MNWLPLVLALSALAVAVIAFPRRSERQPSSRPAPPPGWHVDPENPARSVHEPRSGTGGNTTIHFSGASGTIHALGGGGGGGGSGGNTGLWISPANPDEPL